MDADYLRLMDLGAVGDKIMVEMTLGQDIAVAAFLDAVSGRLAPGSIYVTAKDGRPQPWWDDDRGAAVAEAVARLVRLHGAGERFADDWLRRGGQGAAFLAAAIACSKAAWVERAEGRQAPGFLTALAVGVADRCIDQGAAEEAVILRKVRTILVRSHRGAPVEAVLDAAATSLLEISGPRPANLHVLSDDSDEAPGPRLVR